MKIFSFIISVLALLALLCYLILDFPDFSDLNNVLYFSILLILMMICITGIIINSPTFIRPHINKRVKGDNKYKMHI